FGLFAFAFSFGPKFPLYTVLYYVFPLMRGLRGAARFGQFFLIGVAILAGFGLSRLRERVGRGTVALSIALITGANIEALRAPLLNGYSGFAPATFYHHAAALEGFPDRTSIEYLRSQGVTHVVVDTQALSEPRVALLDQVPELRPWKTDGVINIYEMR